MTEILLEIFRLPMPFTILGGLGLLLWRWRRGSRALLALAAAGLVLTSLPITGKIAMAPQLASVETWAPGDGAEAAAVIVPTGGAFEVPRVGWWPSSSSLDRLAAGIAVLERLRATGAGDARLIVSGGSPTPGAPAEAEVLLSRYPEPRPTALVDGSARNSAETARGVRALLPGAGAGPVVVVTDWLHMALRGERRAPGQSHPRPLRLGRPGAAGARLCHQRQGPALMAGDPLVPAYGADRLCGPNSLGGPPAAPAFRR